MVARCGEIEFSMEGGEGYDTVESVATLRYLVRPLEQTYDDWLVVRRNIMHARSVWGRLGTLIR